MKYRADVVYALRVAPVVRRDPSNPPLEVALRRALKRMFRAYGLRVLSLRRVPAGDRCVSGPQT